MLTENFKNFDLRVIQKPRKWKKLHFSESILVPGKNTNF